MSIEIKPLLGTNQSQRNEFASRVETYGGKCIILVHHSLNDLTLKPSPQQYLNNLDQLISSGFSRNIPLVFAEEAGSVTSLRSRLSKYGDGTAFVMPTRPQSPRPEAPFDWEDLTSLLHGSGVKKAQLGGQRFEFTSMEDFTILNEHPYSDWLIDQMHDLPPEQQNEVVLQRLLPYGCGGMLMCELMTAGIAVELLNASYPSNTIALPNKSK